MLENVEKKENIFLNDSGDNAVIKPNYVSVPMLELARG